MRILSALLIALVALIALPAFAQTAEERARAAELEGQGMDLFAAGNYAEAAIVFQEAYNLDPHPILMFNIGRAQLEMGDLPAALHFFRRVLTLNPDEEVAGFAQTRIDAVSQQLIDQGYDPDTITSDQYVPRGTLVLTSEPATATVYLDGNFMGTTPLTRERMDRGTYEVRLTADGFHPLTASIVVRGGTPTERHLVLEPRTSLDEYVPPSPGYLTVVAPRPDLEVLVDGSPIGTTPLEALPMTAGTYVITVRGGDYRPFTSPVTIGVGEESRIFARMELREGVRPSSQHGQRNAAIGLMAGGGAVVAAGAVLGILAMDSASDYRLSPSDPNRDETRATARGLALGADIAIGVGIGAAAAGLVLLLTDERHEEPDGFSVAPFVSRRSAGASFRLTF